MRVHSGIKTRRRPTTLTAAFTALILAAIVASPRLRAQEPQPPAPAATEAGRGAAEESEKKTKPAEDETEALRHSPLVRWIAEATGLTSPSKTSEENEAGLKKAYWICVFINFAIVVGALWVPLRKRLPGLFKGRTESIQQRMAEARQTSEEARARLAEVEGRLSRLDAEIAAMRHEADENARAEEKRSRAEAEEERRRIVAAAEQEIASAAAAARRDLKAYAGELAVDLAEKRIKVGPDADQALVREFTSLLGKDGR